MRSLASSVNTNESKIFKKISNRPSIQIMHHEYDEKLNISIENPSINKSIEMFSKPLYDNNKRLFNQQNQIDHRIENGMLITKKSNLNERKKSS